MRVKVRKVEGGAEITKEAVGKFIAFAEDIRLKHTFLPETFPAWAEMYLSLPPLPSENFRLWREKDPAVRFVSQIRMSPDVLYMLMLFWGTRFKDPDTSNISFSPQHHLSLRRDIMNSTTMEEAFGFIIDQTNLTQKVAYEVVCDLRHTDLLHNATDTCSWAYSSVDALHGLNLLMPNQVCSNNQLSFMRSLLDHVCNHDVGWTLRWEMCDLLRVLEFYHADSKNKKAPNLKICP